MRIFSKPPKSFKLDRKSPFAAELKSAISAQLSFSLGPLFADDVLAEYVTVLVCNGKNQNQARNDLDAFLGDSCDAFVSWLWDFLLKNERQCTVSATSKDNLTCSKETERRRNALEVNNKKTGHAVTLMQMEGAYHTSNDYKTNASVSEPDISDTECHCKFKTSDHQKSWNSALPKVVNSSPERGLIPGPTSPLSENAQNEQISGPLKKRPSPTDLGSLYCDKVQVSVWDRLSKPRMAALTDDVHMDTANKHREVRREVVHRLSRPNKPALTDDAHADDAKRHREVRREVVHQCMRNQTRIHAHAFKHNRIHSYHSSLHGNRFANDNGRKRTFIQITPSDSSLARGRSADYFYNNQRRPDKRSKFVAKAPEDLLSTVEAVKLRLHLMEREINQLRSRNIQMGNDQKNNSSIDSGVTESTVEDHESRTVLVSNVHYAVKREALCSYFAKCGRIVNVVLLSDLSSFAPDSFVRSAYITFASMESIDKALSLSGTTFYSRVLKVFKYNQKDAVPAVSTSPAISYTKRSVQQSPASEQSVPEPSFVSPVNEVSGNSNLHNAESIAEKTDEAAGFSASDSGDQKPCLISPIEDIDGSSHVYLLVESVVENTNTETAAFLGSGDEQHSLISPMKDIAGCANIHNAGTVVEEKTNMDPGDKQHSLISPIKDVAGYTNIHNAESILEEKTNTGFGDEQHSLSAPVKDISGFTYIHNEVSVAEKITVEAEVLPCGDEQPSLVLDAKDVSEDIIVADNATSVDAKEVSEDIIGADNTTSVEGVIEELQCSDSCDSVKNDGALPYQL